VVHPFEVRFPTPASNFAAESPARELFHRALDVAYFAQSGALDVLLEASNRAWAFGTHLADVLMQTDMISTRMACDQSDQIRSLFHAMYGGIFQRWKNLDRARDKSHRLQLVTLHTKYRGYGGVDGE
jgi:hypothetical protein